MNACRFFFILLRMTGVCARKEIPMRYERVGHSVSAFIDHKQPSDHQLKYARLFGVGTEQK